MLRTSDLTARDAPAGRGGRASRWRRDVALVAALTLVSYLLASAFELQEALGRALARFERWQVDELPFALLVLAGGLVWYAFRRRRESLVQLALREQAEARVAELLARNRELAQQLIALQESERLALARELHDEFAQGCSAVRVETAYLLHCAADDHAGLSASAQRADAAAQSLYRLVRDMLRRLRPADLDALGLAAALEALCEGWRQRTGIACDLDTGRAPEAVLQGLDDATTIAIYRITQEALTNVARHAGATRVRVLLAIVAAPARGLELEIQDDGHGMDMRVARRGLGLLGATERAAMIGGSFEIGSAPGAGVRLVLRAPLPAAVAGSVSPVEAVAA
ncbi:histidine kinase [Rhizobacter fulvus]|jgi:two-component system sensor histidine kinase UhpB